MNVPPVLAEAIATVPPGSWAVGVSGGADSVALLSLLRSRSDLSLHVVHLNHETRAIESWGDAQFVERLADEWKLPCTVEFRSGIEPALHDLPANPSARYRAVRLALFRQIVSSRKLRGVILAHHADDQAETVFHRLLRSSGYAGLAAMSPRTLVDGLLILRPLLEVDGAALRAYLSELGRSWRTDASNESSQYLRNRLRKLLHGTTGLQTSLRELGEACGNLRDWARSTAPVLDESFPAVQLGRLPLLLVHESARHWLIDRGVPIEQVSSELSDRLVEMSRDAATSPRQDYPGGLTVRRRAGVIFVDETNERE